MSKLKTLLMALMMVFALTTFTGCERDAGDATEDAVEDVGDSMEDIGDNVRDGIDDATD